MSLTDSQARALAIIRDRPGIRPREFAKAMWPDSPGWQRHAKSGPKGSHKGGGMYLAGGAYLGRLNQAGWIRPTYKSRWDTGYELTRAGRQALEDTP